MVVREIFGPKREEVGRRWGKPHNQKLTADQIKIGLKIKGWRECWWRDGGVWQLQERTEMHTGFCWGNLKKEITWKT